MPYTDKGTGYRNTDTSAAAAIKVEPKAPNLRDRVLAFLQAQGRPVSTEEIAMGVGKPYASIQPRLSELKNSQKVRDSGQRGMTSMGCACILWEVA